MARALFLLSYVLSLLTDASAGRLLFIAVEGLTDSLLSTVATPAIHNMIATGFMLDMHPEFPAETITTLQSMVTGKHSEVHGMIDKEVWDNGDRVNWWEERFWRNAPNISTIWGLNKQTTGFVQWPGANMTVNNRSNIEIWESAHNSYDIDFDVEASLKPGSPTMNSNSAKTVKKSRNNKTAKNIDTGVDETSKVIRRKREDKEPTISSQQNSTITEKPQQTNFNKSTDEAWLKWSSQMNATISWLSRDQDPVDLVLFFVEELGTAIRTFGPHAQEVKDALVKVDMMLAQFVQLLDQHNLYNSINIILTGIHGFSEVTTDKVFDISTIIPKEIEYQVFGHSPVLNIVPGAGKDLDVYASLLGGESDDYKVYIKNRLPDKFNYKNNDRVQPIVLVANEGVAFASTFWKDVKSLNNAQHRAQSLDNKYGVAGYDNSLDSMTSVVIMRGPAAKKTSQELHERGMEAVDVFPLICHLLNLEMPNNNGSLDTVKHHLNHPPAQTVQVIKDLVTYYTKEKQLPMTVTLLGTTLFLLLCLVCITCCTVRKRRRLKENHQYKYSQVKTNRRDESEVDDDDDKVHLLTSAIMVEETEEEGPI